MGEGSGGSGWVENVDPASGEKMWTNSKTGEISLEDPSNREKAVEEMSFDEKRAYEASITAFQSDMAADEKQLKLVCEREELTSKVSTSAVSPRHQKILRSL